MKDLLIKPVVTVEAVEDALADTVKQLPHVAKYAGEISKDIKRFYMVACGGGRHIDDGIQWWCKTIFGGGAKVQYETHDAADFLSLPMIDTAGPETLVLLTSKSGSTKEALAVGARLKAANNGCKVVCFTQSEKSKIVKYGMKSFYTGDTPQSFHAMLMLHHAFIAGFWAEREGWQDADKLLTSLTALPTALAKAALVSQSRSKTFAAAFDPAGTTYFIGAGPMEFVGKAFGNCLMEEMLRLKINVFNSNHFFHSFVEMLPLKLADRIIILRGVDNADWQTKEVHEFCVAKGFPAEVYDIRDYNTDGIDELGRAMLGPIIVEAALKPMATLLSKKTKDLDERKYMSKTPFWEGSEIVTEKPSFLKLN
ncbi:fructoselysine 6-phosphate deglycase [Phyllobacterium myrsinacearum]|uniref:SIS domain-containing protein n=1 Tax=Phyllobacterium myrsinacearum TaxID=28101 RepID=UPI0010288619|nr:SIS domain-containing protein [Phyllobacterium myrsinacearum]RZS76811.1 fructoselysine 6-phosphate deglycase [Phyllobacterium myrsinacearum]